MADYVGYQYLGKPVIDMGTLTAAGYTGVVDVQGITDITFAFTVASIGTNVVIRLEHSLDETNWANCDADGLNVTITGNGTVALVYDLCKSTKFVRGMYVSKSGGTPVVTCKVSVGGKW